MHKLSTCKTKEESNPIFSWVVDVFNGIQDCCAVFLDEKRNNLELAKA
jgi:hypothetical protein